MTVHTPRGIESHMWHPNRLLFRAKKPFALCPESSAAAVLGAHREEFRSRCKRSTGAGRRRPQEEQDCVQDVSLRLGTAQPSLSEKSQGPRQVAEHTSGCACERIHENR